MLSPEARAVLTDVLRPPPGTGFEQAVALTFTLDLESALLVPLAFAARAVRESPDPLEIMQAVRECADRITIFCQSGNIRIPRRTSDLLAFLEAAIHPVQPPRHGYLYHPKLWVVRYRNPTNAQSLIRLLILSRNLTDDRSWDTCLQLDGMVGTQPQASNRPLSELLRATLGMAVHAPPAARRSAVEQLAEDLRRVVWEYPDGVRDISFYTPGIPRTALPSFTGTRVLVISPFCNEAGLRRVAGASRMILVGRQEDLDQLSDDPAKTAEGVYVLNEAAQFADAEESPAPGGRGAPNGLHAKVYVIEKGHTARVILGSANATGAAFGGNIELLAELTGSRQQLGIDTVVGPAAGLRGILEPYERQAPTQVDEQQKALDKLLRHVAAVALEATVTVEPPATGPSNLTLTVTSDAPLPSLPTGARLVAELLTRPGDAVELAPGIRVDAAFAELAVVDVTPFVVLRLRDRTGREVSTVVSAALRGDPADRLDRLLARQVDTPEKFLRFLALLLGLQPDGDLVGGEHGERGQPWRIGSGAGIFELLLRGLVDQPQQLDALGRLVDRMMATEQGRAVLPEGFLPIWETIAAVRADARSKASR